MDFENIELGRLDQGDWVEDHEIGGYDYMVAFDQNQESLIRSLWNGILSIQECDIADPVLSSMRERKSDSET
ncbi:hypothetical protein F442_10802 [Phytophthora nicotianae P10297]|uniref:Uncharacterized protein n=1 Tax=Phytophthora nicotianae P10297 TaxID=1317064 RepID=W2Z4J9_PHYNI|nr:hypothetical protein F442_10802 [Phytophthora nicotianae P10297]